VVNSSGTGVLFTRILVHEDRQLFVLLDLPSITSTTFLSSDFLCARLPYTSLVDDSSIMFHDSNLCSKYVMFTFYV
jgi:hypothetical protein